MNDAIDTSAPPNETALKEAGAEHLFIHASAYRALEHDEGKRILVEGHGATVTLAIILNNLSSSDDKMD